MQKCKFKWGANQGLLWQPVLSAQSKVHLSPVTVSSFVWATAYKQDKHVVILAQNVTADFSSL